MIGWKVLGMDDVVKDETKDVVKDETKDVVKDETKDVVKDETKDVVKDETKDVVKDETKDVVKDETKDVVKDETKDVVTKTENQYAFYSYELNIIVGSREFECKVFNSLEEAIKYMILKISIRLDMGTNDIAVSKFGRLCVEKLNGRINTGAGYEAGNTMYFFGVKKYNEGVMLNLNDTEMNKYPTITIQ
jgi:hypothetical protein